MQDLILNQRPLPEIIFTALPRLNGLEAEKCR
jgi:hypothetical protein